MSLAFELIDDVDAPLPPRQLSADTKEKIELIDALTPGKVAKLAVPEGQTVRGAKASISRVATNHGKKVVTWSVDESHIYIKLAE